MKTAIIFYSYEGNCSLVSGILKDFFKADVFEIKTVDEKVRTGFAKYFLGGSQVVLRKKPPLKDLAVDIQAYDLIILGTPVWAASPAPAIVSFLSKVKISGKKLAVFCCHGGGMGKALAKLKALLGGNTIVGEIDFIYPARMRGNELKQKTVEWVKSFGG